MNRRAFLASGIIAPYASLVAPTREIRKAITIAHSVEVHMIVTAHHHTKSAERHRREWIGRPFEGYGEFYVDSSDTRPLPPEYSVLPGTLTHHHTTIGVAAARREYLVSAIRRKNITVVVRMQYDHESLMLTILEHTVGVHVPSHFEVAWSVELLEAFIPDTTDIGFSVEESSAFWP